MKNQKPKTRPLSSIPSKAIQQALEDMDAVLADPRYVLNFKFYHQAGMPNQFGGEESEQCTVCFAGSVIAKSLGGDPRKNIEPAEFSDREANMLWALDRFRRGDIFGGLCYLELDYKYRGRKTIEVDQQTLEGFRSGMQEVIAELKLHNL